MASSVAAAARDFLAEAEDDEQRVVDRKPEARSARRAFVTYVTIVMPCATRKTPVTVAAIVQAATANGTRTAGDRPRTMQEHDERDDNRDQLAPAQVRGEDPVEVALDGGLSRDEGSRLPGASSASRSASVCAFASCRLSDVRMSAKTRLASRSSPARPVGIVPAATAIRCERRARSAGDGEVAPRKTTVKTPSSGSSKLSRPGWFAHAPSPSPVLRVSWRAAMAAAVADQAPSPRTTSHEARTATRKRSTARVQRSSTGLRYPDGDLQGVVGPERL